jgi:hypothetical protein
VILTETKVIFLSVSLWAVGCVVYAYYYITTMLALPEPYDAYARNWQFQLMAFCIVRLPFLIALLPLLIIVALVLLRRWTKSMPQSRC